MKLATVGAMLASLVALGGGWLGYTGRGGMVSLAGSVFLALVLVGLGMAALRRVEAGFAAVVVTFLMCVYFAYRMITAERLLPSGPLLVAGFIALFVILLGVFLSLRPGDAARE